MIACRNNKYEYAQLIHTNILTAVIKRLMRICIYYYDTQSTCIYCFSEEILRKGCPRPRHQTTFEFSFF